MKEYIRGSGKLASINNTAIYYYMNENVSKYGITIAYVNKTIWILIKVRKTFFILFIIIAIFTWFHN